VAEIDKAIDSLAAAMDDEIGESLPAAYALLDEGLFRQTAHVVTVEAELIHDYLLSLVPPDWEPKRWRNVE
jgi:hypothetical protein